MEPCAGHLNVEQSICLCSLFASVWFSSHVDGEQGRYVARALSGRAKLPSQTEMWDDISTYYARLRGAGVPMRYAHSQVSFSQLPLLLVLQVVHRFPVIQKILAAWFVCIRPPAALSESSSE